MHELRDRLGELIEQIKADAQRDELDADTYGKSGLYVRALERQQSAKCKQAHVRQLEALLREG